MNTRNHSQAEGARAPSWLPAMVSPPPSCSSQLQIVYVDIMGTELLIKELRSKVYAFPPVIGAE